MIDLLYLAANRLEFTRASSAALIANTDWSQVGRVVLYDDDSTDGTREFLESLWFPVEKDFRPGVYGSPVAVMIDYLCGIPSERGCTFCKIDNDVVVPLGWLGECLKVMRQNPHVDLLGIEAMRPIAAGNVERVADPAEHIGGIGLMRNRCFLTLPRPNGRFGFTAWQNKSEWVRAAWINPALPVFLLDRLPLEPWVSLSCEYEANGWQRHWDSYSLEQSAMWDWWQSEAVAA